MQNEQLVSELWKEINKRWMINVVVTVTVFKPGGKYYDKTTEVIQLPLDHVIVGENINVYMPDIVDKINTMYVGRYKDMNLLLECDNGYPCLIPTNGRKE